MQIASTDADNRRMEIELREMGHEIDVKKLAIQALAEKRIGVLKEISDLQITLDEVTQREYLLNIDKLDLEQRIARLQSERNRLIDEVEQA